MELLGARDFPQNLPPNPFITMLELVMKSHGDNGLALCGERLLGTGETYWLNRGGTPP